MRSPAAIVPLLVAVAVLSGCAAGAADTVPAPAPTAPERPADELTARALVLDGGEGAELCLGGVGESLPPVCGGPRIEGWDWAGVEGEESVSGSTWGDYEVFGTWDGTTFTLTRTPEPYDPRAPSTEAPLPEPTPGDPANAEAVARAIEDYASEMGTPDGPLSLGEYLGRASVQVIHDDGTQQAEADAQYGEDVVEIWSSLRPADGE
ncbi:hypothetical protein DZG00_10660 [Clavibacter lycopersici]|uniref:Uncharacterized protein n=1 Tax=Clavibacter lycopersici TaxID=2301718 RepID=A0A399T7V8_9MICO|nr:hypothetical protein [Clavibacter lycopersici]RIJ50965.1 hypothetical protein DZG00_10660 [Clavibacter lycopersici]RIJ61378.1 hypothetical protein DZG02_07275 [Clavibacter lycopersici]